MFAQYGDNHTQEYLDKLLLVQLEGFVSKFLKCNAKIGGFGSVERMVKKFIYERKHFVFKNMSF